MLNQTKLQELLHYCEDTGIFTNLITRGPRAQAGQPAGCLNKSTGYIHINIAGTIYQAHRLAHLYVTGEWPQDQIDHESHIRSDNAWDNLKAVTHAENAKNQSISSNNTSGQTGITWNKVAFKWQAYITVDGKQIHLGLHERFSEALDTRKLAEVAYGYHRNHGA